MSTKALQNGRRTYVRGSHEGRFADEVHALLPALAALLGAKETAGTTRSGWVVEET
jgi:hypothetical protein